MKIITGQGFDKESAFNKQANYGVLYNATTSWQKAGKPLGDALKTFAESYLETKTKSAIGVGCYIVVESPTKDSREKPYKTENVINLEKRKWKTYFLPVETATGNPVPFTRDIPETKAEGLRLAKELVTELKKDITVEVVKKVVVGQPIAAVVKYSASINTKIGSYIFFGYENN